MNASKNRTVFTIEVSGTKRIDTREQPAYDALCDLIDQIHKRGWKVMRAGVANVSDSDA